MTNKIKLIFIILPLTFIVTYLVSYLFLRNFVDAKGMFVMELNDATYSLFDFNIKDAHIHYIIFKSWSNKNGEIFKDNKEYVKINKNEVFKYSNTFKYICLVFYKPIFIIELKIRGIKTNSHPSY